MRTKLESPGLLLGIAAAGVVAGLLLDPHHGARRRASLSRSLGRAYEGMAEGLSGVTEGLASATTGATRRRQTWGGRLKAVMADAGASVGQGASAVGHKASNVGGKVASAGSDTAHAVAQGVSSVASEVAGLLGSLPTWAAGLASSVLPRRKTRLDRLREAVSDALSYAAGEKDMGRRSRRSLTRLVRQAKGTRWRDVEDEVDRPSAKSARAFYEAITSAEERGRSRAPLISGGAALLLIGSATYLLALSPGAEDRRHRWGAMSRKWIHEVGDFARVAGRRVGIGSRNGRTRQPEGRVGAGVLTRTGEPVSTPIEHPAESLRRAEELLPRVTSDRSDVHLVIREGMLVVQGTAAPEEYDAVIRAVEGVTQSFVNELQAVAPT